MRSGRTASGRGFCLCCRISNRGTKTVVINDGMGEERMQGLALPRALDSGGGAGAVILWQYRMRFDAVVERGRGRGKRCPRLKFPIHRFTSWCFCSKFTRMEFETSTVTRTFTHFWTLPVTRVAALIFELFSLTCRRLDLFVSLLLASSCKFLTEYQLQG